MHWRHSSRVARAPGQETDVALRRLGKSARCTPHRLLKETQGITILPQWSYQSSRKMKTLSVKLPDDIDAKISAVARQQRSNKSEVVRSALDAYLAKEATPRKGSALELAGDLVGSVEGPLDLSHHEKHMRGYGE